MKRILCIGLGLMLLLGTAASATETRVITMGDNFLILEDDANIFWFPSTINRHGKLVVGEFGQRYYSEWSNTFHDLGIHWQFGNDNPINVGTYFSNSDWYVPWPFNRFVDDPLSNQRIDLFGGTLIGTTPVGVRVNIVHSSWRDDSEISQDELGFSEFGVTAGVSSPDEKLDVAAGISLMSFKDVWTDDGKGWDRTKDEGNLEIHAGARYFAAVNSEYTVVPHLVVVLSKYEYGNYMWSTSTSSAELMSTNKINFLVIDVGSGLHWRPGSNVFLVLDFGLMRRHWKEEVVLAGSNPPTNEAETTRLALPYFKVGFEGHVLSWMDVRFGATSFWTRTTDKDTYNDNVSEWLSNYSDNWTYLGFSFHWNRLRIDTYTDPQLFLDGFNFISGSSNDMNFMISALYEL